MNTPIAWYEQDPVVPAPTDQCLYCPRGRADHDDFECARWVDPGDLCRWCEGTGSVGDDGRRCNDCSGAGYVEASPSIADQDEVLAEIASQADGEDINR